MLTKAIEAEIAPFGRRALARASAELTRRYKSAEGGAPSIKDPAQRAAYLAVRLPATFAAARRVLEEIRRLAPEVEIRSVLDLGSGPGTAAWAAAEIYPTLQRTTLIETDPSWIETGKRLAEHSPHATIREAQWIRQDLSIAGEFPAHDLVVLSYALGELKAAAQQSVLRQALAAAKKFLIVIEPGTPPGFGVINNARSALLAGGTEILAPCPHRDVCPLAAAGDWCHFSERVERSSLHRQIKSGELGYEDEKFSYIVAAKQGLATRGTSRIVRHPQKHSGHVQLTLCTARGIQRPLVRRGDKWRYKRARHAQWGDLWEE